MKQRVLMILLALAACRGFGYAQSGVVKWSVLSAGFGVPSSGNVKVTSILGQPFVGASSFNGEAISSGFLVYPFRPPLSAGIQGDEGRGMPVVYDLSQNYPNPFNPTTTIRFALPRASTVRLTVYNVLGQEVAILADEVRPAGYHTVVWNGTNRSGTSVSSGVYIFRIAAHEVGGGASFTQLKKMVLLK